MLVGGALGILNMMIREVPNEKVTSEQRSKRDERGIYARGWGVDVSGDLQEHQRARVAQAEGEGKRVGTGADWSWKPHNWSFRTITLWTLPGP